MRVVCNREHRRGVYMLTLHRREEIHVPHACVFGGTTPGTIVCGRLWEIPWCRGSSVHTNPTEAMAHQLEIDEPDWLVMSSRAPPSFLSSSYLLASDELLTS
jgi:hypothetical protein